MTPTPRLRILIVTQYYWPETFRITELVRSLRTHGAEITVLTGQPNYPEGQVFPGYSAWGVGTTRHDDGYTIHRVPLVPRGKSSGLRLVANYASFAAAAAIFGPWLLRGKTFDVVFVYAPSPILQSIPAILIGRLKKIPVVTWVQDLWPESLESSGYVKNGAILRGVAGLVRWIYRQHDLLLGQSRTFVGPIAEMSGGVPVDYLPQPGDSAFSEPVKTDDAKVKLEPGFNVVFAGNFGRSQALDTLLDAAELLKSEPGVRLVLIGSGSQAEWVRGQVAQRQLTNVQLPGRFALEDMAPILAQASVLLVSLVRSPTMSRTIPGKLQAYLATGRPIVASLDGEGARVILDAGAGLASPAEDPAALVAAVLQLRSASDTERAAMGAAARRYYEEHFTPDALAERLLLRLEKLVSSVRQNR